MDIDAWEEAGLYRPDAPGADERRALLKYLTARGATLEQMVEAHRLDSLPAVAGDLALGTEPATISVEDIAARCGVPVERVQRVLLAVGLPVVADTQVPEDLDALMASFEQGVTLMGEEAILAFTRVLGAAATNIAEAAVALFYAELGPGTVGEGPDELARAQVAEAATLAFTTVPELLSRVVLAHFARATRHAVLVRGWAARTGADGEAAAVAGPSEVVALGFVDLVGSTQWAEGLSLRDHSLALSRFESTAWSSAVLAGGRVVKMIGDEVFFTAPSVDAVCRIASEVCRAAEADPLLPPARGAVGRGRVTPREGDYFGPMVNLVSRLVKAAAPGELVVTEEAAAALQADRWALRKLDPQPLRGLEHPVRVFAVSSVSSQQR
ncbi:MAG: adenylate cyclase regulatory domain-containing protein [Acidimicrobiales bacterium]